MALLKLSSVTETLTKLLEEYFKVSDAWSPGTYPTISPRGPATLSGNAVGIYLYHFTEDPHYKNLPAPGNDTPPVRFVPMGLSLYYQVSAHSGHDDALLEQQMMGIAVKALHDYPIIDDSTRINGNTILHANLKGNGNRLRIELQPVGHNEAVSYWTAGNTPLRLAAYYQVSVVLLEPEETALRAGRVLAYGVHTFVSGAPRINSCHNILSFNIPGEPAARDVELRPAQAPPAQALPAISPPAEPQAESRVIFKGTGLAAGTTSLLLRSSRWEKPLEIDPAWGIVVSDDKISIAVQEKIKMPGSDEKVLPGIYAVIAKVTTRRTLPDGSMRNFEHESNESPFAVTPRIDSINGPVADVWTVRGYIFKHTDIPAEAVQVYVSHNKLEPKSTGALSPGRFKVKNASTIELKLPADLDPGKVYPVRIFVNGAESPPNWIKTP